MEHGWLGREGGGWEGGGWDDGGREGGDLGEECPDEEEEGLWGCGECFGEELGCSLQ